MAHLEYVDQQFASDGLEHEPWTYDGVTHSGYELTPSELFRRQCYCNGWFDAVAPFVDYLGADHMLWSTNLPMGSSTWPRTQEVIERCFIGVSADVREKVLWENAASLYKL